MKKKMIEAHMKAAEVYAELSTAVRLKVGALVVKDNRVISIGYNGMPSGWTNECEITLVDEVGTSFKTKPEVLHAEQNAISKLARSSESGEGATLFITHAPCMECSKLIYMSGISKVYFRNQYRDSSGLKFLSKCNIETEQI